MNWTTASTSDHVALVAQLVEEFEVRFLGPLDTVAHDVPASRSMVDGLRTQLRLDTEVWAAQLLGRDDHRALSALRRILGVLWDEGPDPVWWSTPLGRLVLRRLGHPHTDSVSFTDAGAMLGITRQGAHDLVRRGKLDRTDDGRVSVSSIRNRILSA